MKLRKKILINIFVDFMSFEYNFFLGENARVLDYIHSFRSWELESSQLRTYVVRIFHIVADVENVHE
jgi:hypothetical protein